ncbi:MAG TPA: LPS export ABC transporter permease LptG [Syntrophales bacterium]|nr:LPS export ABC transporter permease LptG [Syntrophales bacterium]HOX95215.1 LPS export ABC transporter permease LptG [Syntrophales bacterium]HPI56941.1 LPS export ABC transporter permease LptG [Syntrophales bacterium]HPN23527.1 LPS export ABC transporter permease LptG [Syntrophales bacterium]HQM27948.1 LPS export ABC transporter permease LptG [Syntrophales bacterium]
MTIISRYITREFLVLFSLVLLSFLSIYLIVDFFERIRMFLSNHATIGQMASYFLYTLPMVVAQAVPVSVLLATLLTFGMFSKNHELVALKASGISMYRAAVPVLSMAAVACVLVFFLNEFVTPYTNQMARQIKLVEIQKQKKTGVFKQNQVWFRAKNSIYSFTIFDPEKNTLQGISINYFNSDFTLTKRIDARSASWAGDHWTFSDVLVTRFPEGQPPVIEKIDSMVADIPEEPSDFQVVQKSADEMGYVELQRYIQKIREEGYDVTRYETDLHGKIAFTLVSIFVVMIGIAFSMRPERSGGVAQGITAGLIIGFSYWILFALCISLGRSGTLAPMLSAWLPNLIFGSVSAYLFKSIHT